MLNNIKKRNEGFTIIEVLIVLAIAGLILLVVFLAVPALQRNSRNNQRRTDAQNLLSAAGEYVSNNSGTLPAAVTAGGSSGNSYSIGGTSTTINTVPVKLGFYDRSKVTISEAVTSADPAEDELILIRNTACDGNGLTAQNRSIVVYYKAEKNVKLCIGS